MSDLQRAFSTEGHAALPRPGPHDWLANHFERGQTFDQFVESRPHKPDRSRRTIYFQPLEDFSQPAPSLNALKNWAAAFFLLPVSILPPLHAADRAVTTRRNPYTGERQLLTGDILLVLRQRLPADAFCVIAITMERPVSGSVVEFCIRSGFTAGAGGRLQLRALSGRRGRGSDFAPEL